MEQDTQRAKNLLRQQLSSPIQELKASYNVVVIGSGYGGGICAARLAGHGKSVCVLERGREFRGKGKRRDFPFNNLLEAARELNLPVNPLGLYDVRLNQDVDVVQGCGLGGTSLINANVMYMPESNLFDDQRWPKEITFGRLAHYYERARAELRAEPYASPLPLKAQRLREASFGEGHWTQPPIAVTTEDYPEGAAVDMLRCVECGSCVSGCNFSAKNTVDMTYLPRAKSAGAEIFTRIKVRFLSQEKPAGPYLLHYVYYGEAGKSEGTISAQTVILAGGSLGSTEILLRSKKEGGLAVPAKIGTQFSGNADLICCAYNNDLRAAINVGPTIVSSIEYWQGADFKDHFIVEEGAMPKPLIHVAGRALASLKELGGGIDTDPGEDQFAEWLRTVRDLDGFDPGGALDHSLLFLGIGHDSSKGRIELSSKKEGVVIKYPGYPKEAIFLRMSKTMLKLTKALGGTYIKNPRWSKLLGGNMTTVHPLGGCPMDGRDGEKVVDHLGLVHGHRKLYVADGAILPTAVGVNPAFTIAALAERIAENIRPKL